jgi:transposase
MDRRKDGLQIQRLEVVELGRRRRWTAEAKLRIVEESFAGHRQASATARRYGISNALLFSWRKAYRGGRLTGARSGGFMPAVIVEEAASTALVAAGRLEIVTRGGYRVIVDAAVDEAALLKVLAVLARS